MATGVSSRTRRPDNGGRPSGVVSKVPSYPLPVSLGAAHSSSINSPHTSGPTPGPAPSTSRKGSNGNNHRQPPPPSQDPRQYAQHFPSLPDGGAATSRRDTSSPTPRSEGNDYDPSADSEERWQHQQQQHHQPHHHRDHPNSSTSYPPVAVYQQPNALGAYHHPGQDPHHPHHPHMQQPANWTPYIYPPHPSNYGAPPQHDQQRYHHQQYPPMHPTSSTASQHPPLMQQQPDGSMAPMDPRSNAESPVYHHHNPHPNNTEAAAGYYHYVNPNEGAPTYVVMNTPPPNIDHHPQINYMHPHHHHTPNHHHHQNPHSRSVESTGGQPPMNNMRDQSPSAAVYHHPNMMAGYHPPPHHQLPHHNQDYSDQQHLYHSDHPSHPQDHPTEGHNGGSSGQPTPGGSASIQNDQDDTNDIDDNNNATSSQTIKVRAVISGWKAGTIIGRQGQVISSLRTESQCKITISDDPTPPDRVLTIIGHPTKVAEVLRRVCFMIGTSASSYHSNRESNRHRAPTTNASESDSNKASPASSSSSDENTETTDSPPTATTTTTNDASNPDDLSSPVNFTLAVPSPLCGCLIGRGGIQIKTFRQTYGVSFSVSSHPILESLDRPVNISGSAENVANCLEEVCRLFAAAPTAVPRRPQRMGDHHPLEQQQMPPPQHHQAGYHPHEVEGPRHGGGGFRSNWRRNLSDADVHHHGGSEEGSVNGDRQAPSQSQQQQQPTRRRVGPRRTQEDGGSNDGGEILGNAIEECSFELSTGETEVHLLVPNDIVGCIIGKGGKTISEIRATSGAVISITESSFPPPMPPNAVSSSYPSTGRRDTNAGGGPDKRGLRSRDRVICIRGRSKNIRTARYLMGSSILNAQRTGVGMSGNNSSSSQHHHLQPDTTRTS